MCSHYKFQDGHPTNCDLTKETCKRHCNPLIHLQVLPQYGGKDRFLFQVCNQVSPIPNNID